MKKIFYFILFTLPFFSFSQSKSDLEKELKIMNEKNEKLEKKVKELTDNVDKLTVKNENKKADKTVVMVGRFFFRLFVFKIV